MGSPSGRDALGVAEVSTCDGGADVEGDGDVEGGGDAGAGDGGVSGEPASSDASGAVSGDPSPGEDAEGPASGAGVSDDASPGDGAEGAASGGGSSARAVRGASATTLWVTNTAANTSAERDIHPIIGSRYEKLVNAAAERTDFP